MTDSFLGRKSLELGPCRQAIKPIDQDWADPSGWTDIGNTESNIFRRTASKSDLVSAQTGTEADNKILTGQFAEFETNMGKPTLERLELTVQDLVLEKTGQVINQWMFVQNIGQSDEDVLFWSRLTKLIGEVPSTDPLDAAYAAVAPASEAVELTFDSAAQRFFQLVLRAYANNADRTSFPVVHSITGQTAFVWSGSNI